MLFLYVLLQSDAAKRSGLFRFEFPFNEPHHPPPYYLYTHERTYLTLHDDLDVQIRNSCCCCNMQFIRLTMPAAAVADIIIGECEGWGLPENKANLQVTTDTKHKKERK